MVSTLLQISFSFKQNPIAANGEPLTKLGLEIYSCYWRPTKEKVVLGVFILLESLIFIWVCIGLGTCVQWLGQFDNCFVVGFPLGNIWNTCRAKYGLTMVI